MCPRAVATAAELAGDYDALLIDAYGVLVDSRDPLPGAAELLGHLRDRRIDHYIVTNDASRLPETVAARLHGMGLGRLEPQQIVTSGSLLASFFATRQLAGARCIVLGTADSVSYVRAAGGVIAPVDGHTLCDVVVVCDEDGYEFLPGIDATFTAICRQLERGHDVTLVMPNPDLIYPQPEGAFGFTSGGAALLLEAGLERRFPRRGLRFERLGKPFAPIFDEAKRRAGSERLLMLGDQLETDIAGARNANLDAALLVTGVTRWDEAAHDPATLPTYVIERLV